MKRKDNETQRNSTLTDAFSQRQNNNQATDYTVEFGNDLTNRNNQNQRNQNYSTNATRNNTTTQNQNRNNNLEFSNDFENRNRRNNNLEFGDDYTNRNKGMNNKEANPFESGFGSRNNTNQTQSAQNTNVEFGRDCDKDCK